MPESPPDETARICRLIWEKERSIYEARGRGDLKVYADEITDTYLAWPPHQAHSIDAGAFRGNVARLAGQGSEQLEMAMEGFTLDGDTAIVTYRTHRTCLPDGRLADEHFEVIHVWLRRDAVWRLFGGMARNRPQRA